MYKMDEEKFNQTLFRKIKCARTFLHINFFYNLDILNTFLMNNIKFIFIRNFLVQF
jgi:hypothetical protein